MNFFQITRTDPSVPEQRLFMVSLCVSVVVHAAALLWLSSVDSRILTKPVKQIEVTYRSVQTSKEEKAVARAKKEVSVVKDKVRKQQDIRRLQKPEDGLAPVIENIRDMSKLSGRMPVSNKSKPHIETPDLKRAIIIPSIESEKLSNPKYLSYRQTASRMIRERLMNYVKDPDYRPGNVYITFALHRDGTLKDIKLIDHKTHANDYVRQIAVRSVRETIPQIAFPSDLPYAELTFNLQITFVGQN